MRRVTQHFQFRKTAPHLKGHMPHGGITVLVTGSLRKTAVYQHEPLRPDTCRKHPLHGTRPQTGIGHLRILHQHQHLRSTERIGHLLYAERITRRTRPYPHHIGARTEGCLHMAGVGDLDPERKPRFRFRLRQPLQADLAHPLKTRRIGTGFPHPSPYHIHASAGSQSPVCRKRLLAALDTARSGYYHRSSRSFCCHNHRILSVVKLRIMRESG